MNSLRDMMETTFAAATFAERNLDQDARECLGECAQSKVRNSQAKSPAQRQRPSLKA